MNFVHKLENIAWQIDNCKSEENLMSLIEENMYNKIKLQSLVVDHCAVKIIFLMLPVASE